LLFSPIAYAEDFAPPGDATGEAPSSDPATEPEGELEGDAASDEVLDPADPDSLSDPQLGVEEIVITGEVLEQIDDESTSIVGFDQSVLRMEGIKDIRDLSNFTPTLEIKSAFAATNPTIFIRGVGLDDFNANAASAVAIYQDDVYLQSPAGQLFQFFDTENVQVLRGPQPTLYRNASAGAILVSSRKPSDEFNAYLTGTYGNYNLIEVEGAVGGPIIPDWLSGRLSASWGVRDGITENRCAAQSNQPDASKVSPPCNQQRQSDVNGDGFKDRVVEPGLDQWTNDINAYAARGQLLLKLPVGTSEMEWLLNGHGGKNLSRALQYQHTGVRYVDTEDEPLVEMPLPLDPPQPDFSNYWDDDGDPFAGDYNIDGPEDLSLAGANLRGSWLFGEGYQLESLTAYEWHDRFTLENSDANPNFLLETEYVDTAWQLSQQLDLRGSWSESDVGGGSWVLGAYYLQEDLDVSNFFDASQGAVLLQEYTQNTRNFAAYAQSEYKFQPGCARISCDFTLLAGLRYNLEYKKLDTFVCSVRSSPCAASLAGVGDDQWDGLGGEASLSWNYTESSSLYVKYSRGWKGGHFNGGAVTQFDVITGVDPEIVNSYEAGLRSLWFDDRLMLNTTGFYYDYQDLQVFQLEQTPGGFPIPKLVNANDAVVYGVELDVGASPLPGLNFTYNFAWVESEYVDFSVELPFRIRGERPPGGGPRPTVRFREEFVYSGNPLIASPRFSMTGSVDYTIPLPGRVLGRGFGSLTPRFSFSWKDDIFFDACSGRGALCNFPEGTFGQKAFSIFNAALTWRSENERIEVTGWVRNFMDQHYKTQSFDLSRGFRIILDAYADPRTFGITATLSF
jgi:iron complex outermembrane receptor protein